MPVPKARLCLIRQWPGYSGYGFNLKSDKGSFGEFFLNDIQSGSPSSYVGLTEHDMVIEVNNESLENMNHIQVSNRIKGSSEHLALLVVDKSSYNYFKERDIHISSDMEELERRSCPQAKPGRNLLPLIRTNRSVENLNDHFLHD